MAAQAPLQGAMYHCSVLTHGWRAQLQPPAWHGRLRAIAAPLWLAAWLPSPTPPKRSELR